MIITRGGRQWNRRTHAFSRCAHCDTFQGPRKYAYDPLPGLHYRDSSGQLRLLPDSPICHRYAFCNIECHNQFWSNRNPERCIR